MSKPSEVSNPASLVRVEATLSIADVVRDHPWPLAYADARRLERLWIIDVDLASERLWSLVSDVSRLNRALGNPEMTFREEDGLRYGEGRYGGIYHAWQEAPWEWVAGQWFAFSRLYSRGAMRAVHAVHRFESIGPEKTRLYVYFGVVPRSRWLTSMVAWNLASLGRAYRRCIPRLADNRVGPALPPVLVAPGELSSDAERRVSAIEAALAAQALDPGALRKLVELVRTGDDLDVVRLQVRQLARSWQLDEHELLRACLHATRAGLLELVWDVVCPHCRGVRAAQVHLDALAAEGSCEVCDVTFGTAEAVEVSFRVHRSLRSVTPRLYCSAEPATKTHIRVQRALGPGGEATIAPELAVGRYRLRTRASRTVGVLDVSAQASAQPVTWLAATAPGERVVAPETTLALVNDAGAPETFVVEASAPADFALRPRDLFSLQEFRDLFSEEFLGADVQLSVGEQTILFTDMVGSTAMYARQGDPAAFVTVKQHFATVFGLIAAHRGAVVKTIGDAAMGAFTDPLDAVRAAEAIQRAFVAPGGVRLRISINTGPCIAVQLNANLDYFGNAVNLAAKLQSVVDAGQIVASEATYRAPGVAEHLAARVVEAVGCHVKGLPAPAPGWRWTIE